jgi:hypothetical protein
VVDPAQGKAGSISLKRGDKTPLSAFGVGDYSHSCPDSQFISDLSVRWPPFFTSAGWSPAGLGEKGGCLLLLASSDGQTTVHEAGGDGGLDWATSWLALSFSQPLFGLCKAGDFEADRIGQPLLPDDSTGAGTCARTAGPRSAHLVGQDRYI